MDNASIEQLEKEVLARDLEVEPEMVQIYRGTHGGVEAKFDKITTNELLKILGLTVKRDETNKLLTFLAELSAYTEDSQLNISFNAPSSTGKSFIPTEIAKLFPKDDVLEVGYCSPTAFFHDHGVFNKEEGGYKVDLSRKILIFLDQPHTLLLQHLRPLLSHDKKVIQLKITDKNQRAGLRTKNITLIGYPVVVFCTAGLSIDEQEATRFLLLSPEIDQEKIRQSIFTKIAKESNLTAFSHIIESDPKRQALKNRIEAIKNAHITEIRIGSPHILQQKFFDHVKMLKPRHQRDIARVINLTKVFCLLNLWDRDKENNVLTATEADIEEAFKLWNVISESQELNLPPYVYNLYKDVVVVAYQGKNRGITGGVGFGLTRQEITKKHFEVYHRFLDNEQLRKQIIPMLEAAGLIFQEQDSIDKRKLLVYPTVVSPISQEGKKDENEVYPTTESPISSDLNATEKSYLKEADNEIPF